MTVPLWTMADNREEINIFSTVEDSDDSLLVYEKPSGPSLSGKLVLWRTDLIAQCRYLLPLWLMRMLIIPY